MTKLKNYNTLANQAKPEKSSGIPSGIQSPNSKAEMMVCQPLKEHPELKGLYRAYAEDPDGIWYGWVPYEE